MQAEFMKHLLNWSIIILMGWSIVASAIATTITNASWTFPTNTISSPSQPIGSDLSTYSTGDNLSWIAADTRLNENFVPNLGQGTALEFSYNGNHSEFLNGSALTLTSTVSGLPSGFSLVGIQLSYQTKWNLNGNSINQTWAYSLNGGAFVNFETDVVTGNLWQTEGSFLNGLVLTNGETIAFSDTITGAIGNNGSLEFDNVEITSTVVSEPPAPALITFGGLATLVAFQRRRF
jgi:hypothetical protein